MAAATSEGTQGSFPTTGTTVSTSVDRADGHLVLRKTAITAEGRIRLDHESRLLQQIRQPGVVHLVDFTDDGSHADLTLAYVGSHTLATVTCRTVEHAAGLTAAVAETVADLHQRGVVHGHLHADQIMIDGDGRTVVGGFGQAGINQATAGGATRADDVADLAALLRSLVERVSPTGQSRRSFSRSQGHARRALLTLADETAADDPQNRPSARRLAAQILIAAPGATLARPTGQPFPDLTAPVGRFVLSEPHVPPPPVVATPDVSKTEPRPEPQPARELTFLPVPDRRRPTRHRTAASPTVRILAALILVGFLLAVIATVVATIGFGPPSSSSDPSTHPSSSALSAAGRPERDGGHEPEPVPTSPAPVVTPGEYTKIETSGVVTYRGHRYAIGDPGDEIVVGDFTCTGSEIAVVLRPVAGDVFAFDDWAHDSAERSVGPYTHLPPEAHWLPVFVEPRGCPHLAARLPDGHEVTVAPPTRSQGSSVQ